MRAMRRVPLVAVVLLLSACAVARWQVPTQPLRGQDAVQVEQDRRECDDTAHTGSGYSRAVEAKTWLWGIFVVAPTVAVSAAIDYVTLSTTPVFEAAGDALKASKPEGNPNFETYFAAYRACMEARGYTVTR
jgi:hypothetical protein